MIAMGAARSPLDHMICSRACLGRGLCVEI